MPTPSHRSNRRGRKASTAPTPPSTPSVKREERTPGAPAVQRVNSTPRGARLRASRAQSRLPGGPKASVIRAAKTSTSTATPTGPRVSRRSILRRRAERGGTCPRSTCPAMRSARSEVCPDSRAGGRFACRVVVLIGGWVVPQAGGRTADAGGTPPPGSLPSPVSRRDSRDRPHRLRAEMPTAGTPTRLVRRASSSTRATGSDGESDGDGSADGDGVCGFSLSHPLTASTKARGVSPRGVSRTAPR